MLVFASRLLLLLFKLVFVNSFRDAAELAQSEFGSLDYISYSSNWKFGDSAESATFQKQGGQSVASLVKHLYNLHAEISSSMSDGTEVIEALAVPMLSADEAKIPLTCGGIEYTAPIEELSAGSFGMTVVLHRKVDNQKVVAKLNTADEWFKIPLPYECDMMKFLEERGVPGASRCESQCQGEVMKDNGWEHVDVIVTAPFVSDSKAGSGSIERILKDNLNEMVLQRATDNTIRTGFAMLANGVCNFDQAHNILYAPNGEALFIDMGLAVRIETDLTIHPIDEVKEHGSMCEKGLCDGKDLSPKLLIDDFLSILWEKVYMSLKWDSPEGPKGVVEAWQDSWEAAKTKATDLHRLAEERFKQLLSDGRLALSLEDGPRELDALLATAHITPRSCNLAARKALLSKEVTPTTMVQVQNACGSEVANVFTDNAVKYNRLDYIEHYLEEVQNLKLKLVNKAKALKIKQAFFASSMLESLVGDSSASERIEPKLVSFESIVNEADPGVLEELVDVLHHDMIPEWDCSNTFQGSMLEMLVQHWSSNAWHGLPSYLRHWRKKTAARKARKCGNVKLSELLSTD